MRITGVRTFLFNAAWRNWVFVKVETDEGLYGWGEASLEGYELAVEAAILQPDIIHIGGILEAKKLAAMASAYYIPIAPHSASGPVLSAASVHVDASTPNFLIQEFFLPDKYLYDEILEEPFLFPSKGFFSLPTKPGLGIDIKEATLAKRPYQYRDLGAWQFTPLEESDYRYE